MGATEAVKKISAISRISFLATVPRLGAEAEAFESDGEAAREIQPVVLRRGADGCHPRAARVLACIKKAAGRKKAKGRR